jgi:hypothetical protein
MKGLRIAVVTLLLLGLAAAAFAQDLILMHDKGGNPNYQPFYEAMGK